MRSRLARWIVDRYPPGWRERYGDEVRALLDDGVVTWADVFDLFRGSLSEWKVARADPERHPVAYQFLTVLELLAQKLILLLVFVLPTVGTAWWLRARVGTPPDWAEDVFFILVFVVIGTVLATMSRKRPFAKIVLVWWVPISAVTMVLAVWFDGLPELRTTSPYLKGTLCVWIVVYFMSAVHRRQPAWDLVEAIGSRRYLLRWAKLEVARCESLDTRDSTRTSQLGQAQAEVDRLNRDLQLIYTAIRERRPLPAELTQPLSS